MERNIFTLRGREKRFSSDLLYAFVDSSLERVKELLAYEKPSEIKDAVGSTLLHLAVLCGRPDFLTYLIEEGCCIDARNDHGVTPLMYAVQTNDIKTTAALCDAGADIFLPDNLGQSPLTVVADGRTEVIEPIIKKIMSTLSLKVTDDSFLTMTLLDLSCPLYKAVYLKNVRVTTALIERGLDVKAAHPRNGNTALHIAVKELETEQVRLLLECGADPNAEDEGGQTPLAYVSPVGSTDILSMLLDNKADIYKWDAQGIMQVEEIMINGDKATIETILKYKPDFTKKSYYNCTMINYVAQNMNEGVAKLFLTQTFEVNLKSDETDEHPLYTAAYHGNHKFAKVLLCFGATVDPIVLFLAIETDSNLYWRIKCIELLLANGADINLNYMDRCIVEECLEFGNMELIMVFMKHVAYLQSLDLPVSEENLQAIQQHEVGKKCFEDVTAEIKAMKELTITGSVTYFDVLFGSVRQIAKYARNETFRSTFETNVKNLFPLCYKKLVRRFKSGVKRFYKTKILEEIISDVGPFNPESARKIVDNLRSSVITKLIKTREFKTLRIKS